MQFALHRSWRALCGAGADHIHPSMWTWMLSFMILVQLHASFRWLVNQGNLAWELGGLTPPRHVAQQGRQRKSGQATAVAPPMLRYLEEKVERLHATGEPRWSALLASWIAAAGCLRQKHIARSQPRKLTKSTLHCECSRGKQKKLRKGFSYCIPSHFSTGWPWAQHMIQRYDKLPDAKKKRCGLCFDEDGTPWHMREITLIAREIFVGQVEHPQTLTSYSWRRWAPSMGQVLGFDPLQLASLSDWQDKTSVPENASMPLHYSGARYALSMKSKQAIIAAAPTLGGYESWELIPPSAIQQAKSELQDKVDRIVHQDSSMLWAMPMSAAEVRSRFQLTTALKRRAAEMRKQSEAAHVGKTMPASINGRLSGSEGRDDEGQGERMEQSAPSSGSRDRRPPEPDNPPSHRPARFRTDFACGDPTVGGPVR